MPIHYKIRSNSLKPGTFYAAPVSLTTRRTPVLVRNIARKTSLSPADVGGVITALIEEIVDGLSDGDRVSIDGLANFSVRLSAVLGSADDEFDPASGGELSIAATIKSPITQQLRQLARFNKLVDGDKVPILKTFFDVDGRAYGQYTPGSIAEVSGKWLKLQQEDDPQQGLFFINAQDGSESRAAVVQRSTNRRMVFLVPPALGGNQIVELRTRYGDGGELRRGRLTNVLSPAVAQ